VHPKGNGFNFTIKFCVNVIQYSNSKPPARQSRDTVCGHSPAFNSAITYLALGFDTSLTVVLLIVVVQLHATKVAQLKRLLNTRLLGDKFTKGTLIAALEQAIPDQA
jgi:hypothetical protein